MRILSITIGILLVIFLGAYTLAFTQFGNDMVKPYIEKEISKQVGEKIKLKTFSLRFNSINVEASLNEGLILKVQGGLKLLSQYFDIDYEILADNIQTKSININKKMGLKGKAKGTIDDFDVNGQGFAFGSNLRFLGRIKDNQPLNLNIDAKNLQMGEILEVVGKPKYANATIDIIANIKEENQKPKGQATINIKDGVVNQKAVLQDFNITLEKTVFKGDINADIQGDIVNANTNFLTSLAELKTTKTNYNLSSKILNTDFDLNLEDLAKLQSILKQPLKGSLKVKGDFVLKDEKLEILNANVIGLGGQINSTLKDNTLKADIKNIQISNLFALVGKPIILKGILDGEAKFSDLNPKNLKGSLNTTIKNGEILSKGMEELSGTKLPDGIIFNQALVANFAADNIGFSTNLASNLLSVPSIKGQYNIKSGDLDATYKLSVEDLSALEAITGQKLAGDVKVDGEVILKNNELKKLLANGKAFGGDIKAKLENEQLDATLKQIHLEDLFALVGLPAAAKGILEGEAVFDKLDLDSLNGKVKVKISNGIALSKGIEAISGLKDFPNYSKFSLNANSNIKSGLANFEANFLSDLANLSNLNGNYHIKNQDLKADYTLKIDDLSKLKFIIGQKLIGNLEAKGIIEQNPKNLKATANADFLKGKLDGIFDKGIANLKFNGFNILELLKMLDYPQVYKGNGNLNANYNTNTKKGNFRLTVDKGQMLQNQLTSLTTTFTGFDLTKEIYKDSILEGTINKDLIDFYAKMKAKNSDLNITNANINTLTSDIDAPFSLSIKHRNFKGKIKGKTNNPKVTLKTDGYIKNKATKELGKLIDKNLKGNNKEVVKDLLKIFK